MMEPVTLATSAVALLSPYLVKSSEAFAKKFGEAAFEGAGRILALVKDKVSGRAEEALVDLEQAPDNDDNQSDLRKQLGKALQADPDFAEKLKALIEDVEKKGGAPVTQMLNVSGHHNKTVQNTGSGNSVNIS